MQVTIKVEGKKKHIGEINGETFVKKVKKSKHLFRKSDAWGFDYDELVNHILPQVKYIFVHDTEENVYYYATAEDFGFYLDGKFHPNQKRTEVYNFKGNGVQIFMPRRFWSKFNKGQYEEREAPWNRK